MNRRGFLGSIAAALAGVKLLPRAKAETPKMPSAKESEIIDAMDKVWSELEFERPPPRFVNRAYGYGHDGLSVYLRNRTGRPLRPGDFLVFRHADYGIVNDAYVWAEPITPGLEPVIALDHIDPGSIGKFLLQGTFPRS